MHAETLTFLHALYEGVEGFLTLTAIHPQRKRAAPSRHVRLGNTAALNDALARLHAANAQGWGAYFAVALRTTNLGRWRRGGKEQIASLPALFVDIDGEPDASLPKLRACTPAPSCIVHSGGGLHGFWFIRPTTDFVRAERILHGLAARLSGDRTNSAQSLRLPGSVNTKPTRHGALCHMIELHPERRYTLADFTAMDLPAPVPHNRASAPTNASGYGGYLNPALVQAVVACLLSEFQGYVKLNGYIAALCPCGHCRDYPGSHFNFDPGRALGMCFGKHGRLLMKELCSVLQLYPAAYR